MAQVPFSNPAGNNQMSPATKSGMGAAPKVPGTGMGNIPFSPSSPGNPFTPAGSNPSNGGNTSGIGIHSANPMDTGGAQVPNVGGLETTGKNVAGDQGALLKQLVDIYGKGTGGALANLLENMSGVDSKVLQEFIASLQPQMASAQANVNAALGAGGVSSNSSVAAIADANLQSQEFAAISGESAKLTQSQEDLTAQILMGMTGASQKEVASSAWTTFADVMNNITGDIGNLMGGSYTSPQAAGAPSASVPTAMSAPQLPSFAPAQGDSTNYNSPEWAGLSAGVPTDASLSGDAGAGW